MRNWIIAAVVFAAVLLGVGHCLDRRADRWEQRAREALVREEAQRSRVEALLEVADSLRSQAVELEARADARDTVTLERIVRLPPAETAGEHARDTIIAEQRETITDLRGALALEQAAGNRLRAAFDTALARGDSLAAVLRDRPSGRPWYLPRLGVGPGLGYHDKGVIASPLTLHLSWELRL